MILESTNHAGIYRVNSSHNFWAIGVTADNNVVVQADGQRLITLPVYNGDGVMLGGWVEIGVSSAYGGFAVDDSDMTIEEAYEVFKSEIARRNIVLPEDITL